MESIRCFSGRIFVSAFCIRDQCWRDCIKRAGHAEQTYIEKTMSEYEIPQYPLPPRPASAPPPTMPFAIADTSQMNAYAPPSQHVSDFKVPGSYNGDKEKVSKSESANLKPDARTGDIAYDEPPTTRNIVPPTAIPPGPGFDGTFEMRKDSVNPYCSFCMAYMLSISHGLPDPCRTFAARSQEACKQVVAALKAAK